MRATSTDCMFGIKLSIANIIIYTYALPHERYPSRENCLGQ